jgi:hypothetical protein
VAAAGVPAEPRGKRQKMVTFKKIETAPRGAKQQVGVLGSLCVAGLLTACAGKLRQALKTSRTILQRRWMLAELVSLVHG